MRYSFPAPSEIRRWLSEKPRHRKGIRILQVCLGAMLLFRVFTEGPFARYLWGPNGIGEGSLTALFGPGLGGMLDTAFTTPFGTWCVLGLIFIGALGLVMGIRTRWATGLALIGFLMIQQRLNGIGDGGDNLTHLLLTYMLFVKPVGASYEEGSLSVWLHNLAVGTMITQIIILYATAGFMKVIGDRWHHGTAVYYISQVEWFSHPLVRDLLKHYAVVTVVTYVPMLFMCLFPVAIFSPVRHLWIVIGISFHLGIALMMGLLTFSTVMIGCELFLLTDNEIAGLQSVLSTSEATTKRLPDMLTEWVGSHA